MDLLVTARTSKAPGEYYRELNAVFARPTTRESMRWRRPNIKRGRKLCRQRLPRNRVSASGSLRSSATPPATLGSTALHYMQRRVRGQSWGPRRSTILAESFKDEAYLNAIVRDAPQEW